MDAYNQACLSPIKQFEIVMDGICYGTDTSFKFQTG